MLPKIKNTGICGLLGRWLGVFLMGRRQQVKGGGLLSEYIDVISGVTQGTILGPLLFIIFINNIDTHTQHSRVSCYADDTKVAKSVSCTLDCEALQDDF